MPEPKYFQRRYKIDIDLLEPLPPFKIFFLTLDPKAKSGPPKILLNSAYIDSGYIYFKSTQYSRYWELHLALYFADRLEEHILFNGRFQKVMIAGFQKNGF